MPSYLITGAGRGIGFGFLDILSRNEANVVVGLVRNKATAEAHVTKELAGRTNIHIIQGDMSDHKSLKDAVDATAAITGGSLDVLIANANPTFSLSAFDPLDQLGSVDDDALQNELLQAFQVNVIGNIYLTNMCLPLIRKGKLKKLLYLSSGLGDINLAYEDYVYEQGPYSISKAALNMAVAKYHAKYGKDGILFLAVSPGVVDSGSETFAKMPDTEKPKLGVMLGKFKAYAPDWQGPISVEESVNLVLGVVDHATPEREGGQMVSHLGNKRWL